ncbi:MAG: ureidoglycolate lyase [Pseudomonadota bacterium]
MIIAKPLMAEAFAPFGDVIETGADPVMINNGTTERHHDLARVDLLGEGAHPLINIFRGQPFEPPVEISIMERHPLGSQAFMPLSDRPYLIVVAEDREGSPGKPVGFLAKRQGVNYRAGVWHHPLLSLEAVSDFLVVDRGGDGVNLEEALIPPRRLGLDLSYKQ